MTTTTAVDRLARAAAFALVALGLLFRLRGSQVSFWMDEAWVANSLLSPSWRDVFYYPPWLQTSPPGFLVLARLAIDAFGTSHLAFRAVPLISAAVGLIAIASLSRRILSPLFSLLALSIVALSPTAIQYSRMLKQYSTEHAVGAVLLLVAWLYFFRPTSPRYWMLVAATALGMLCAYGAVFVVGGVLLLLSPAAFWLSGTPLTRRDVRRWLLLCGVAAATLALEYAYFYLPNTSPALKEYWNLLSFNQRDENAIQVLFRHLVVYARHGSLDPTLTSISVFLGVIVVAVGLFRLVGERHDANARRQTVAILCLAAIPATVLVAAGALEVYPNTARTSLVVLPGIALLIGYGAQASHQWAQRVRFTSSTTFQSRLSAAAWGLVLLLLVVQGSRLELAAAEPVEDYRGAMTLLGSSVSKDDVVYVHACCEEGFRLYRILQPWAVTPTVMNGTTGQPCCPRNREVAPFPTDQQVRQEVVSRLSPAFTGRVWLLYVDRADYWRNASGRDEAPLLGDGLRSAGCMPETHAEFRNMSVVMYSCRGRA